MPAWIWQKQIDEFSKKYHLIAIDPRSQGESDKPSSDHLPEARARDYKEVVDQLGLKQPVLVGWSMACGELMKYVENYGTTVMRSSSMIRTSSTACLRNLSLTYRNNPCGSCARRADCSNQAFALIETSIRVNECNGDITPIDSQPS